MKKSVLGGFSLSLLLMGACTPGPIGQPGGMPLADGPTREALLANDKFLEFKDFSSFKEASIEVNKMPPLTAMLRRKNGVRLHPSAVGCRNYRF